MESEAGDFYNQPQPENMFMKADWFQLLMSLSWMIKYQIMPFKIQWFFQKVKEDFA